VKLVKIVGKSVFVLFECSLILILGLICYILIVSRISPPIVPEFDCPDRIKVAENHYSIGDNYIRKNDPGIWEMYIEGDAYERGVIYGKLSKELCQKQEEIFVGQIEWFVPSSWRQQFLKLFLGFFNKDITAHIQVEYQQELYGVSHSFNDKYNYIAPKYMRILNYHAAHDIGHALNDYSMVGCSSFAIKGDKTVDQGLMAGRVFDFYVGEEFAEEKVFLFVKPTKGYAFCSYSWAGFMGVGSGMNEKGISVTINASKSDLPTCARTPVSMLAREILQYAKNTEEAIEIAKKRTLFVSETIMVGSKEDNSVVLIEKSPTKTGVKRMTSSHIICTNHYQSDTFKDDKENLNNIKESDSKFRFDRIEELLAEYQQLSENEVARILRDQYGLDGDTIGMTNPKALNQLSAHHSCIFKYETPLIYVSTNNWSLGKYIGYDVLKSVENKRLTITDTIAEDPFLFSKEFILLLEFKETKAKIDQYLLFDKELNLTSGQIASFIQTNAECYLTYELLGKYYLKRGNNAKAKGMFEKALTKELPSEIVRRKIIELKHSTKST
jgi:isopenicillin-N N-acyltransferase like protein